jgi:tRNA U34 5-carboxymethylaminomethyl modifying GTPase MnmE/TrmE
MTIGAMNAAAGTALPEHAGQRTIFALASGSVRAAIAVIRISGAASGRVLDALCRSRPAPPERAG